MRHTHLLAALAALAMACSPSEPSALANVALAAQQGDAHAAHGRANTDAWPVGSTPTISAVRPR